MKLHKILSLTLALVLLFSLVACARKAVPAVTTVPETANPPSTTVSEIYQPSYNVYLSQVSDSGIFSSDVSYVDPMPELSDVPDDTKREVQVKGVTVPLSYDHSASNYYRFVSEDGSVKCNFHYQTGKLLQISVWNGAAFPVGLETEEQYVAWAKQFVSEYVTENWDDYVYSCETVVNTSTATSSANDKYDTYVRETKENETISRYSFYFTRYVNEIATSDRTEVAVFPTTGTVIVKFDQHAFDAVKSTSLDEKTILQKIDSFLKQSLTDSYVFVDYVLQMPRLIAIDGKCYLEYTVSLSLSSKDDPECIFTSLEILVVEL